MAVSPSSRNTVGWSGRQARRLIARRAPPMPSAYRPTSAQEMCFHSNAAREKFEMIWMNPCITMAVATGTNAASTPISKEPPAMPKTPDIVAVISVAARIRAMTGADMCEESVSAKPNQTGNESSNAAPR